MTIKLSICIPTFNRAKYICETLESIISQASDEVEIVISDNASTDDTEALVNKYQSQFSNITYFRWGENRGPDRNFLKVVDLAQGSYCWLMGSDDTLASGAIERMLQQMDTGYDIYLCNRMECDIGLKPIRSHRWLTNYGDELFDFNDRQKLVAYLNDAQSLGSVFSYISAIVVRRQAWNDVAFDESFIGSCYSHVYILLSIVLTGAKLKYIVASLVNCRSGNDSFLTSGYSDRVMIDFDGYMKLSSLFEPLGISDIFLNPLRMEHAHIRLLLITCIYQRDCHACVDKLMQCGFPKWKVILLRLSCRFAPKLKKLYTMYKLIKK